MSSEPVVVVPDEVITNPALLFLYHRIEQILGIRTTSEALIKLNRYIEEQSGSSFIENSAAYERMLTSREKIYEISGMLTVNETYFFREGMHFNLLTRNFLPELVKLKRPIKICSAATSIGCEAYSLAMLFEYHAKNGIKFEYEIDAFDISSEAIETAKKARYTANALRAEGSGWKYILDLYVTRDRDEYVVSQDICSKVQFFTHNIMRGLEKHYDIIFFRNALIYFSSKNRLVVLDDLAEALFNNGVLFLGISETSSVRHPLLVSQCLNEVYFFQKTFIQKTSGQLFSEKETAARQDDAPAQPVPRKPVVQNSHLPKRAEHPVNCGEIAAILEIEEGQSNAKETYNFLTNAGNVSAAEAFASLSDSRLIASVVFFLNAHDLKSADLILSYLEKCNNGAPILFLRGEYYLLQGNVKEAEHCFDSASVKEKSFWPAFYRIALFAAEKNTVVYKYKIKKAYESLDLGREFGYECFMGGFSSDYFRRILEKKCLAD